MQRLSIMNWGLCLDHILAVANLGGIANFKAESPLKPLLLSERRYYVKGDLVETWQGEPAMLRRPCVLDGATKAKRFELPRAWDEANNLIAPRRLHLRTDPGPVGARPQSAPQDGIPTHEVACSLRDRSRAQVRCPPSDQAAAAKFSPPRHERVKDAGRGQADTPVFENPMCVSWNWMQTTLRAGHMPHPAIR